MDKSDRWGNFLRNAKNSGRNPKTNEEEIQEREGEGAQQIHFHISGVGKIWSLRKWQKIDPRPLVGREYWS